MPLPWALGLQIALHRGKSPGIHKGKSPGIHKVSVPLRCSSWGIFQTWLTFTIQYKWTYSQNRNRLIDIENKFMVTRGESVGGGINQEFGVDHCIYFSGGSHGQESACNTGYPSSFPGLRRSPGGGHGNPLQDSCLENPHGQRSLACYSPRNRKELDTTEWLTYTTI